MDSEKEMVLRGKVAWQGERTPADDFEVCEVQARVVENDISKYFAVRSAFLFGVADDDAIEGPFADIDEALSAALRMQDAFIDSKKEKQRRSLIAEENAKKVLKPGDRLRVTKCPGTKRWITFACWDGHWIVSKSGINDFSPMCVDMLNGKPVDFTMAPNLEV